MGKSAGSGGSKIQKLYYAGEQRNSELATGRGKGKVYRRNNRSDR